MKREWWIEACAGLLDQDMRKIAFEEKTEEETGYQIQRCKKSLWKLYVFRIGDGDPLPFFRSHSKTWKSAKAVG